MGVPQKWRVYENPTKMDDLGVPLFLETTTVYEKSVQCIYCHVNILELLFVDLQIELCNYVYLAQLMNVS